MNRKAALLLSSVFVLGIALGALGMHLTEGKVWSRGPDDRARMGPSRVVEELTRELALTPEQQQQLTTILEERKKKFDSIYAPIRPQIEQARQEGRAQIRSILTQGQLPKFEDYLRRIDEERKKRERR